MSTVSSASSSTSSTSSTASASNPSSAADIQDRFLTLLVAQMTNQDPLNPMDNAALTTQLAQISTVTGIENVNSTLASLVDSLGDAQGVQAADLIDKTVLAKGNNLTLSTLSSSTGEKVSTGYGAVSLASPADSVTVTIKDAKGNVVQTLDLGAQKKAGDVAFSWDGSTSSGGTASDGEYTFTVTAKQGDNTVTATALQYATVKAVSRSSSGFVLDFGSKGSASLSDVQQIL